MICHIITPVWGESYTDIFLRIVLPNLLSDNNLSAFAATHPSAFKIYTTGPDKQAILASAALRRLAGVMPVEFFSIEQLDSGNKYNKLIQCHGHAAEAAHNARAAMMILPPDQVYSDGTFRNLAGLAALGKRLVMTAGIRTTRETFVPALLERFGAAGDPTVLPAPARELAFCALNNLHPISQSLFWNNPRINFFPAGLYWRVADQGFLARCFHLHPLYIDPRLNEFKPLTSTVDGEYVENLGLDPGDVHVAEDSDDMLACEISGGISPRAIGMRRARAPYVALWARRNATPMHREFFRRKIRIHTGDLSPEWERVEAESDRIVASVFHYHEHDRLLMGEKIQRVARETLSSAVYAMGFGPLIRKIKGIS